MKSIEQIQSDKAALRAKYLLREQELRETRREQHTMKTPITASADDYQIRAVAQKLERDRAALMEALERCLSNSYDGPLPDYAREAAQTALTAARANFPTP